jgi:hypothetical protein
MQCSTLPQLAAIMKNRLKSIQYRPALIDGFLAQTGLSIEPERRRPRPWPFSLCNSSRAAYQSATYAG